VLVAVGCPQIAEPVGGWVKQDSEEAVLGCHSDVDDTWRFVCHGSAWIGDDRNCTSGTCRFVFTMSRLRRLLGIGLYMSSA